MMKDTVLFLVVGLLACGGLAMIFRHQTEGNHTVRYLLLLGAVLVIGFSMSFFVLAAQYFLLGWMATMVALALEVFILFLVFGMLFGLDYHEMTQYLTGRIRKRP